MSTSPRPRFSVRIGLANPAAEDGPFDGVPRHLDVPLRDWVQEVLIDGTSRTQRPEAREICLRMRLTAGEGRFAYVDRLRALKDFELLDAIDQILQTQVTPWKAAVLEELLDHGGSAYRVSEEANGLEERVTPAVRDAVLQTVAAAASAPSAGSAADHLATAWRTAYGRDPNPSSAYSEAIKAVEAAAHSVVQGNHSKATLGTMLGEINNARPKFGTALSTPPGKDPIAPIETMMRALWDGQTSRHGGQLPTVPETLEAARAAVHLASALVQWFVSGSVVRNP
ncbi:hypothetical protein [Streptomyces poriferorum]|uniref:Abortive infection protein-like C-terminal domain-containing protein n=1 Tax=Streptomyces poriferorum TaxID=2798799 RepID=A0ABY9J326_9ACTN|nr:MULTISPECIES: hypothetical protein [unclassified Streptomyces]MDP5317389.1 hypothetical protein [Streptomyces sp. Alt4]WLQ61995.1 hypothetical protein P8A19_41710 [Streptomyces sp. Alt2]